MVVDIYLYGACGNLVVKALSYKPEDRRFDTRGGDFFKFT
jgi:hypothetical protein